MRSESNICSIRADNWSSLSGQTADPTGMGSMGQGRVRSG